MSGFKSLPDIDETENELWVCGACNKPTRMTFEKDTDMMIPRLGTAILSWVGHNDGTATLTWATTVSGERIRTMTFNPYPRKNDMTDQGRNHLLKIWNLLDIEIEIIMDGSQTHLHEHAKARGSALADVIFQLMGSFYPSRDDVTREALARHQAEVTGIDHLTHGLAEVIWNPSPITTAERHAGAVREITPVALDPQKSAFVKHAMETGAMEAQALADMFGVSLEVIKASVDS